MKIACVTTTINVPRVLALYARHSPDVRFFVVGDRKSDDSAITNFLLDIPNHSYYGIDTQHALGYECSRMIGENCIQRRNIATLEALKWGADIIVSIDDDNIPLGIYFDHFESILACSKSINAITVTNNGPYSSAEVGCTLGPITWSGLKASSFSCWFDVGQLLQPKAEHRGFPHTKRAQPSFEPITDAKVGVAAGICLGDPDVGAAERIANGPMVHGVSELLRSGIVTDPRETWTVFNSQNTAFIRDLAPAMFMLPGVGRYDDIYASLITQRVMREKGLHVHFGKPFVWQERNKHNLTDDLLMEIMGMRNIERVAEILEDLVLEDGPAVEQARACFLALAPVLPEATLEAAMAWCDDIEKVL